MSRHNLYLRNRWNKCYLSVAALEDIYMFFARSYNRGAFRSRNSRALVAYSASSAWFAQTDHMVSFLFYRFLKIIIPVLWKCLNTERFLIMGRCSVKKVFLILDQHKNNTRCKNRSILREPFSRLIRKAAWLCFFGNRKACVFRETIAAWCEELIDFFWVSYNPQPYLFWEAFAKNLCVEALVKF